MTEWPTVAIGDVAKIFDGPHATPKTVTAGPIFLGIGALQDGRINLGETRHVTPEDFASWTRRVKPQPGDVVFSYETRLGQAAIIPEGFECCLGRRMGLVRTDRGKLDPKFFLYYYLSPLFQDFLRSRTVFGATVDRIALKEFPSFPVALPDLRKQRAIADVLGSLDDKIELNRRMNETLEAMAQAIFRDWFVDFGPTRRKLDGATDSVEIMGSLVQDADRAQALADLFPATHGDNGLPEGWKSKSLLDQANWINGAAYKNMHFSDALDALPVVKIAELKNGVTSNTKRTNTALGERYRISDGELLFSWSGNPDTSIDAFVWIGGDAWLNQHIFAVRENGVRSKAALYVLLKALMLQFAELARNKQTTGLGHVTKEDMKRLEIAVAPTPVEAAFESLVTPLIDLLVNRLFESRTLAATRDLLLSKLMSGEIRLSDAEDVIEASQ
ncbi:restriction endonuclease subunit S [Rhizobium sp. NZLR10]|uniref:restriction endonuclease subunit S n=1 Tax=Rhizobium sp. NZLR10 TaxID=2731097 RepID=UPI001C83BB05|nr:restriction endonuclease subunit S [Rhizobium sp. NZLR10]MBX5197565.1 restriction endonuclease subunit S [Rhizobium sp. NZLR10]